MLRLRLRRIGKKNSPAFRLIVTPRRAGPKTGRFLEILGSYDPRKHVKTFKKERILSWIKMGAQPSDTVRNMLISEGIIEGRKVRVDKKSKNKEEKISASPVGNPAHPAGGPSSSADEPAKNVANEEATAAPTV